MSLYRVSDGLAALDPLPAGLEHLASLVGQHDGHGGGEALPQPRSLSHAGAGGHGTIPRGLVDWGSGLGQWTGVVDCGSGLG